MNEGYEWIARTGALRIGQRLHDRRRALGLTRAELAIRAGVAQSKLGHWESGRLPGARRQLVLTHTRQQKLRSRSLRT